VPVVSSSISCKFVLQGEETYIIEGRAHRLLAGDFIIVDAGVEGSIDIPRRERTIAVSAYLGNSAGDSLLPGYGPVMRPPPTGPLGKLLSRAATKFARNPKNRPHDATLLIRQLDTAVHGLAVEAADRLRAIRLKKPSSRQELLGRLEQARAYLEENFDRAMTLSQVSRVAGVSPFHLNRHFSALFGEPPLRYHRRIRLERVADLLRNGEVSPSVAAEMLDYSDLPTFTRAFKSTIGVPPSALMPALS
jgi:AraC-like DNA-binding protein